MAHLRLFDVKSGTVRVRAWDGGPSEEKRLADLGLHPGTRIEVVQHSGENGMLVAVNDDARIVVDPKTAGLVLVSLLEQMLPALTLSQLVPGDRARIVGLSRSRLEYRQKLMSMGLTPGVEFEITRAAPLGDPVEIRVRGFAMSLRKAEADMVAVEKL
ncbi:FeoA family protein [Xanthobacter sp. V4C-4]|uniref:FeoA family protein n=1 Tax=Xanthobacter cornucopiae TaxID=3119924 RepID=UPI003728D208